MVDNSTDAGHERMLQTQGLMVLLGALTDGLESLLGKGSQALCQRSGRLLGVQNHSVAKVDDPLPALQAVDQEMRKMGISWPFELYKKAAETEYLTTTAEGTTEVRMVFRNCIVRCTLFRYGFPQEMSLCQTKHGLFCGLFEAIYGVRATMSIDHSGENSCLLRLRFQRKG